MAPKPAAAGWRPESWRDHPAGQQPEWEDAGALDRALKELRNLPPLVFAGEARALKSALGEAAQGKAFVLQAGECAESFDNLSADAIRDQLKIILQMSVVLTYAAGLPVIKVGRIAGQFAKPRSEALERLGDRELPAFRGHMVNAINFDPESRRPDPQRLVRAYHQASSTLNLLRAFTKGGFADLTQVHMWNREFVAASPQGQRYEDIAAAIDRALRFMAACGIDLKSDAALHQVDFYTCHEALILGFEEALTRSDSLTGEFYDCSAHLLWAGERTREPGGAHLEFLSGIHNPVACKVGPNATPAQVLELCDVLDPDGEPGRLSLIARMGAGAVRDALPPLVAAVRDAGRPVVWVCDPMHGNTFLSSNGLKTRRFEDIVEEIKGFFAVHEALGTFPGGVHLELTPDNVTECLGGVGAVQDGQLDVSYRTLCDPRLNGNQSLELAFEIGELLQAWARG
ncbi:MAG TPA: 3-deoxy-7-phosphoheptulonate synthase class II [Actinomycetota bacterium]|nr:3-deoxy-7-phosphoheptulonate synthase class II [Actinomycetota bacterium]